MFIFTNNKNNNFIKPGKSKNILLLRNYLGYEQRKKHTVL